MPRLIAPAPGTAKMECYYYPIKGTGQRHILPDARGFDTEEKWVEVWMRDAHHINHEGKPRMMTADGRILAARLYINYDVIDKTTGMTLYTVRQDENG